MEVVPFFDRERVFPTRVGVNLTDYPIASVSLSPHTRGGEPSYTASSNLTPDFHTRGENLPPTSPVTQLVSLPHTRGGEPSGTPGRVTPWMSSPHAWG